MQHVPRISEPFNPIEVPCTGAKYRAGNYETSFADYDPSLDLQRLQQQHDNGHHTRILWLLPNRSSHHVPIYRQE
jgi:hypothetical protein